MVRGAGMPSYRHHDPGNLYVQFEIEFPTHVKPLDSQQRATLKTILGLPPTTGKDPNGMQVDEEEAMEVDPFAPAIPPNSLEDELDLEDPDHGAGGRGATMDDEDEDGVPHGAERVQCAGQ